MPKMCFSYQPDPPQGIGTRAAAPPALRRMPSGTCFSYTAEVPRRMSTGSCFSYSVDAPQPAPAGLRRMPVPCFSYPHMCFSYPDDVPLGNRDAARSPLPGLRRMPGGTCFRY